MNRFRVWGLSVALAAGVGGQASAADPGMQPEQTTIVQKIKQIFEPRQPKPAGPTVRAGPMTITAPLPPAVVANALHAEQAAWLRRVEVCTELRRVAEETGDLALARQADELEKRATSLYNARAAALGAPRTKAPFPNPSTAMNLEEPPPAKVAANRLTAPAAPVPDRSTAEVREVKP